MTYQSPPLPEWGKDDRALYKKRAQVKSRFYYIFWGAATLSVLAGQVLVGTGYRRMSDSMDAISADINLLVEVLTMPSPKTMPIPNNDYRMPILQ